VPVNPNYRALNPFARAHDPNAMIFPPRAGKSAPGVLRTWFCGQCFGWLPKIPPGAFPVFESAQNFEELCKLVVESEGVEGLKRLATQAVETAKALSTVSQQATEVAKKTLDLDAVKERGKGLVASIVEGSADLPSVVKGLGDLMGYVPFLAPFAKYVEKAGDAAQYAWPMLKNLYEQWEKGAPALNKAAEETEDYGERIDELGESIKNLTDRTASLNAEEERNLALKERQKKMVADFNKLQPPGVDAAAAEARERAENLQATVGGKQEDLVEAVALGMAGRESVNVSEQLSDLKITDKDTWEEATQKRAERDRLVKRAAALQRGVPKDIQKRARETAARAVMGGSEEDIREILTLLPTVGAPAARGQMFRQLLRNELPENREAEQAAYDKFDAENKAWHDKRVAREKFERESRELTVQGAEYQAIGEREQERQRQDDARQERIQEQERKREFEQERQARPQRQAETQIRGMSRYQGLHPTDEQVKSAAAESLRLVAQGASVDDARMMAFRNMVTQARALQQRIAQQQMEWMRLGGGADTTGNFSMATPFTPGPG
jgi:hypothetical protein